MTLPTNEAELKKTAEKLAKLKVNGVSDTSIRTISSLTDVEWNELQDSEVYKTALEAAKATVEILPVELDISIKTLEKQALAATIRNVNSGICTPEYVLDALKYATKVRMEEAKQEQERKTQFTANTQIVINMSDLLKKAIEATPVSEKIISFDGESRSVTNGLDTDRLMAAALGKPEDRPKDLVYSSEQGHTQSTEQQSERQSEQPAIEYPPAYVNSYNPSYNPSRGTVKQTVESLVITDDAIDELDEMEEMQEILFRPQDLGE